MIIPTVGMHCQVAGRFTRRYWLGLPHRGKGFYIGLLAFISLTRDMASKPMYFWPVSLFSNVPKQDVTNAHAQKCLEFIDG